MAPTNSSKPVAAQDVRIAIRRSVLSESSYPNKSSLDRIANNLRQLRARGRLIVNFSDGAINTITFEARNELNGHENIELQFTPATKTS